jgi:hypothetical protein
MLQSPSIVTAATSTQCKFAPTHLLCTVTGTVLHRRYMLCVNITPAQSFSMIEFYASYEEREVGISDYLTGGVCSVL